MAILNLKNINKKHAVIQLRALFLTYFADEINNGGEDVAEHCADSRHILAGKLFDERKNSGGDIAENCNN